MTRSQVMYKIFRFQRNLTKTWQKFIVFIDHIIITQARKDWCQFCRKKTGWKGLRLGETGSSG